MKIYYTRITALLLAVGLCLQSGLTLAQSETKQSSDATSVSASNSVPDKAKKGANKGKKAKRSHKVGPRLKRMLRGAGDEAISVMIAAEVPYTGFHAKPLPRESIVMTKGDMRRSNEERIERIVGPKTKALLRRIKNLDPDAKRITRHRISATLTRAQLRKVAKWKAVRRIEAGLKAVPDLASARVASHVNEVHDFLFYKGEGVKLAQVEVYGKVNLNNWYLHEDYITQGPSSSCSGFNHASQVAGVMVSQHWSDKGFAPDAELFAAGRCGVGEGNNIDMQILVDETQLALNWGADVVNMSYGNEYATGDLNGFDQAYDEFAMDYWRALVTSSGNNGETSCHGAPPGGWVGSPGKGYNVITVGAYDDTTSTDKMWKCSAWNGPNSANSDRVKPEIVAPGKSIRTTSGTGNSFATVTGTSFATPQVTATAGLMIEADSSLTYWPEAIRAILVATARRVDGSDGTPPRADDKAGFGRLDSTQAVLSAEAPLWEGAWVGCGESWQIQKWVLGGQRVRVVASWFTDPDYSGYFDRPSEDISLEVRNPANTVVGTSDFDDNTVEVVDFVGQWGSTGFHTYKVSVDACHTSSTGRYVAIAWWVE